MRTGAYRCPEADQGIGDLPELAPVVGDARRAHLGGPRLACVPPRTVASSLQRPDLGAASEVTRAPPVGLPRPRRGVGEAPRTRRGSFLRGVHGLHPRRHPLQLLGDVGELGVGLRVLLLYRPHRRQDLLLDCRRAMLLRRQLGLPIAQPAQRFLPSDWNYSGGRILRLPHCGLMDRASPRWIKRLLIPIVMSLLTISAYNLEFQRR